MFFGKIERTNFHHHYLIGRSAFKFETLLGTHLLNYITLYPFCKNINKYTLRFLSMSVQKVHDLWIPKKERYLPEKTFRTRISYNQEKTTRGRHCYLSPGRYAWSTGRYLAIYGASDLFAGCRKPSPCVNFTKRTVYHTWPLCRAPVAWSEFTAPVER